MTAVPNTQQQGAAVQRGREVAAAAAARFDQQRIEHLVEVQHRELQRRPAAAHTGAALDFTPRRRGHRALERRDRRAQCATLGRNRGRPLDRERHPGAGVTFGSEAQVERQRHRRRQLRCGAQIGLLRRGQRRQFGVLALGPGQRHGPAIRTGPGAGHDDRGQHQCRAADPAPPTHGRCDGGAGRSLPGKSAAMEPPGKHTDGATSPRGRCPARSSAA
jgi:hypothetical protein